MGRGLLLRIQGDVAGGRVAQPPANGQGCDGRVDPYGNGGFPAKCAGHERAVPVPFGRDHQHRRRGKRCQGAADGNIHKEHAQRQVFDLLGQAPHKQQRAQGQSRHRHGGRFGDEGTQQGQNRQTHPNFGQMAGYGQQPRKYHHQAAGYLLDRARGRHHHHHKHEQRFGVLAALYIAHGFGAALHRSHGAHQHHGPEAEYNFHFTQQVKKSGMPRLGPGQAFEEFGAEGMDQRQQKKGGANHLHG